MMQNVSDIKLAQNRNPELPVPRAGTMPETGSAAGFFNLLKSQLHGPEESGAGRAEKMEPPKNAGHAPEKEKGTHEAKTPEKEAGLAAGKTAEQAKPAIKDKTTESKRLEHNEVKGTVGEKKPAPEAHPGKPNAKIVTGDRSLKNNKSGKMDAEDIGSLFEGLSRITDTIKTIQENPLFKNVHPNLKRIQEFLTNAKTGIDKKELKRALEKAASLLERLSSQHAAAVAREQVGGALASVKNVLAKLRQGEGKNSNQKTEQQPGAQQPGLKEATSRLETRPEGMRGEGFAQRQGNDGTGPAIFGPGQAKNDASARKAEAPQTPSVKNSLFRESLEEIIHKARVAVRDSQNASFSIRLHPRELGSVNINLGLLDGVVHGRFLVETQEAKDTLQSNLAHLIEEMRQAGITVGEFQVNVSGQRERLLDNAHDGLEAFLAPAPADGVEGEFAALSLPYHDGYINVLI